MQTHRDRTPGAGSVADNSISGKEFRPPTGTSAAPGPPDTGPVLRPLAELIADRWRAAPPLIRATGWPSRFADDLLGLLFPHFADDFPGSADHVHQALQQILRGLGGALTPLAPGLSRPVAEIVEAFAGALPDVYQKLLLDADAIYGGDPAAESVDEVIAAYPGFQAIAVYRLAHELSRLAVPIVPRLLTEHAHQRTGIDIHPGATIGTSFCIDHGTGIVVGETT